MINPEKSFNTSDYKEIFVRRIWYIVLPFILVLAGAVIYALTADKEYRASTLILVTPQKVPESFVRPTVTSKIEDRLQSIGQEIMSRTRLEQIINQFKLYPEAAKSKSREEIVEGMRKNIRVEIKGKEGFFTISYIGKDPRVVTTVTNKLASLFIEENLKLREVQAQGTSEFLSIELKGTQGKLEEQEKALTHFKKQFMGELPEQRDANLRVLDQLQLYLQKLSESLRSAQDRRLIVQKQLSDTELLLISAENRRETDGELAPLTPSQVLSGSPQPRSRPAPSPRPVIKDPQEVQLEQLKNHLIDLQARYTERHPDILVTRRKIADLEPKVEKIRLEREMEEKKFRMERELEEKKEAELKEEASSEIKTTPMQTAGIDKKKEKKEEKFDFRLNPRYKEMESQLIGTELEITRLKEEEAKIKGQINRYRDRVENTPVREIAMAQLMRDYQTTRENYQTLLKKSEEAQQAENLERRQKGEQFKVIDPARLPEKPFRPDIPKILLLGLLIGLSSGFGLAFFREQMDRSFRDAEDLEATLGFKVLANIPKIDKKAA